MVDRPLRQDAVRFEPPIGRQQLTEIAIGIRDMVGAGAPRVARRQARDVDQSQAVMLVVIAQKAQTLVAEDDSGSEHRLIPLDHLVELTGAQHEMGEFGRADRSLRQLADLYGDVVHPSLLG